VVIRRSSGLASFFALLALIVALLPANTAGAAGVVATVAGSFQSEVGCPGDWQPDCDRTVMSDPDGNGIYTYATGGLPIGVFEYKIALNQGWDVSYPVGNLTFSIANANNVVTISYDSKTNAVNSSVSGARPPAVDGDLFWDGLGHDSRDALYRLPQGAVTADTPLTLRFRTYHNDATGVTLRTYHSGLGAEQVTPMTRVAQDVSCYAEKLPYGCDLWQAKINASAIGTIYYRFIVRDGAKTVYYEDDSDVRDGGMGKPFENSPDWGWAITVYAPSFNTPVGWMKHGVVYQVFPDRFANADPSNDPTPVSQNPRLSSDPRYAYPNSDPSGAAQPSWDQIVRMKWGALPEGHCRNYQDISANACPVRFNQPASIREQPRGRDYYGGDLEGVTRKLGYLQQLGVTIIYFNPVFAAGSNHRYDTRDYRIVDPYLGDLGDWKTLESAARKRGMRVILDGVFNHMSADSPLFDRYHNFNDSQYGKGACEDANSAYRMWFRFRTPASNEPAACAPYTRDDESYYASWAGFDSLPQLSEAHVVQAVIYDSEDSVARYWLKQGAEGWRLDVMQDKSIPFWEGFRMQVKDVDQDAIIIGELWKKFDVLPYINGNTADTTMNYRLRDAVLGLLAPGAFDGKGFPGSGQPISPAAFEDRLESVREDYPDAAYYSLMNLLDSHDTERLLWTLTPGAENTQEREQNAANVAEGKARQRLAALIQMTMPGAPTIYYGDEVALTGDDDPDDRRTYPWGDDAARQHGDSRQPDTEMFRYYRQLTAARAKSDALVSGDIRFLLAGTDTERTVAYGRKDGSDAAIVAVNSSEQPRTLRIPVTGYLPNNTKLVGVAGRSGGEYFVQDGHLTLALPALSGWLLETRDADLTPPAATGRLTATADGLSVAVSWSAVRDAAGYDVYRSPVSGGGYVLLNATPLANTSYSDSSSELRSGQRYHYVVRAVDSVGNESADSSEASAVPFYRIGWANLQWPPTLNYTVSARNSTDTVYGQVFIDGVTSQAGATPGLTAQLGYGPQESDPRTWDSWVAMEFNVDAGNNDEYQGELHPSLPGTYSYFTRYSTNAGEQWVYGDLDGLESGSFADQTDRPGTLTVQPNADQIPPEAPGALQALNNGATSIALTWTSSVSTDVYRYDVYRSTTDGGGYAKIASDLGESTGYTDTGLQTSTRYYYIVRAVDDAANESTNSDQASAVPTSRDVAVTFEVTVPAGTPADQTVYIVGNQQQICNWCNPHTIALTRGADGVWRATITFVEGTLINYKHTLGTWDTVEKDAACSEITDRAARVVAGPAGTQLVRSTVQNWRNVAPCGN